MRYPELAQHADSAGATLSSMTYTSEVVSVALDAPLWQRILAGAVNWLA
jgi:hypothetical protein